MADPGDVLVEYRIRAEISSEAGFSDADRLRLGKLLPGQTGFTYYGPETFTCNYTIAAPLAAHDTELIKEVAQRLASAGAEAWPDRKFQLGSITSEQLCPVCGYEPAATVLDYTMHKISPGDKGPVINIAKWVVRLCTTCAAKKPQLGFCERDRMWVQAGTRCRQCQNLVPLFDPEPKHA